MKHIFTIIITSLALNTVRAQPVISSGFVTGMAAINGTTYTHTGNIGLGNYQFVCASKNEPRFFASSFTTQQLYFIDVTTSAIIDSMAVNLYDITAMNENSTLFAVGDNDEVYRINTATKAIVDSANFPSIHMLSERPGVKEIWGLADGKIYVIDYTSGLSGTPLNMPVSSFDGLGARFTTGGSLAYLSSSVTNKLYKVDAATKTVIDSSAAMPVTPYTAEVSHDSSKVFVSSPNAFVIYIFNAATMALTDSINTGTREPFELYRHPSRQELWVVNHFKDSLTVYDENTGALITAFDISSSPHFLAFASGATSVRNMVPGAEQILVFPNPASETLNIVMADDKARSLLLYDTYGRCIRRVGINTRQATLDISGLAKGTYFMAILQDHRTIKTLTWTKE